MKIKLSGITKESIVDGPGFRYVVFTQGCPHHCKGCHNPQTHDPNKGYLKEIDEIIDEINQNKYLTGITISGGEPLTQMNECLELVNKLRADLDVIIYTGFTYEYLIEKCKTNQNLVNLLNKTKYLIDGKFLLEQKDLTLSFRGSTNQRIIDIQKSLKSTNLVLQHTL